MFLLQLCGLSFLVLACQSTDDSFAKYASVLADPSDLYKLNGIEDSETLDRYVGYLKRFGKTAQNVNDFVKRSQIYKKNMEVAEEMQKLHGDTAKFGETSRSDFDNQNGLLPSRMHIPTLDEIDTPSALQELPSDGLPDNFDWREKGIVTPVRNQIVCGSCYAFAVAGAIEADYKLKTNKTVVLSVEEIVECSRSFGNEGCHGGEFTPTLKFIQSKKGLFTEEEYPYTSAYGRVGKCHKDKKEWKKYGNPKKFYTPKKDEETEADENLLRKIIKKTGPMLIAIDGDAIQGYQSGIINGDQDTWNLSHAVVLVGWGKDKKSKLDYWIVKNSWGQDWGENGYFRVVRGRNYLGLAQMPVAIVF